MTAVEDARIAVLTAASEVLHARSDTARARANRHLDEALEAWGDASSMVADLRALLRLNDVARAYYLDSAAAHLSHGDDNTGSVDDPEVVAFAARQARRAREVAES